jgi:NhaP-type Na+/H+ and K+/H+ antiporter
MRNTASFESPITIKGFLDDSMTLTRGDIISEMISRIMSRDEVPLYIKFITKGMWKGQNGMSSASISVPSLHPIVCKYVSETRD